MPLIEEIFTWIKHTLSDLSDRSNQIYKCHLVLSFARSIPLGAVDFPSEVFDLYTRA